MSSPSSAAAPSAIRDEVVAALDDFYTFLAKLPWIEPSDVLHAPEPGGWPNIDNDNLASLDKTEEVLELLRHLPYVRMDGENGEYVVAYSTFPCDYRRDYFQPPADLAAAAWDVPETGSDFKFPAWVVPLTFGKNHGNYLMLDITDGTVMRYQVMGARYSPAYDADDPRRWRNVCAQPAQCRRLGDILNEWKVQYADLRWIGFPRAGWPHIWTQQDSGFKDLQQLIQSHGWPHDFDREECKKAMIEWEQKQR